MSDQRWINGTGVIRPRDLSVMVLKVGLYINAAGTIAMLLLVSILASGGAVLMPWMANAMIAYCIAFALALIMSAVKLIAESQPGETEEPGHMASPSGLRERAIAYLQLTPLVIFLGASLWTAFEFRAIAIEMALDLDLL